MLNPFTRREDPHLLIVGMTGIKMGDRFLQLGCAHGGRLGAVARKVGLSGRAVAVVPDDASAVRARKGAEQAGVLVEVEVAPPDRLPLEDGSFDVAVVDDTAGLMTAMTAETRVGAVRELARVLRPGGRVIVLLKVPRGGLGSLLSRAPANAQLDAFGGLEASLGADGFRSVRKLGERDGLGFIEGIKPRPTA